MSFLFGSSSSTTEIPEWLQGPTEEMLQRSIDQSKVGYMPWAGPTVAAFDPAQVASMQNTNTAAQAFGMNAALPRINGATDYGNGMWGYSSMPLYDQQQSWMATNRPGQQQFFNDFFVDPVTGQAGRNMLAPVTTDMLMQGPRTDEKPYDYGGAGDHYGGGMASPGGFNGETGQSGVGGIGDMFGGGEGLGGFFGGIF